jgi:hypothetical protein
MGLKQKFDRKLVVCVTSTIRADLLSLTLRSFHSQLFKYYSETRIIANLDPLYSPTQSEVNSCVDLLRHFDSDCNPIIFQPKNPDFNGAVRRLWTEVVTAVHTEPYFLHLEDDWFLCQPISPPQVENHLANESVGAVRLFLKRFNELSQESAFSLNPCFIKTSLAKSALDNWEITCDPEKLVSALKLGTTILYSPPISTLPTVLDIGTSWRKGHRYSKRYQVIGGKLHSTWSVDAKAAGPGILKDLNRHFLKSYLQTRALLLLQKIREWLDPAAPWE